MLSFVSLFIPVCLCYQSLQLMKIHGLQCSVTIVVDLL